MIENRVSDKVLSINALSLNTEEYQTHPRPSFIKIPKLLPCYDDISNHIPPFFSHGFQISISHMSIISSGGISTISNWYMYFGWTTSSNFATSSCISWCFDGEDVGDERIIARRQWDKYLYICSRSLATLKRRDLDTYLEFSH